MHESSGITDQGYIWPDQSKCKLTWLCRWFLTPVIGRFWVHRVSGDVGIGAS
jgi:hypothetical protein